MNLEKFTDRARGFLQAAQTIAQREDHQKLMPEHLLKALLDDEQGMAASLIGRAGGAPERVREKLDAALAKMPRCWARPRSWRRRRATVSSPWSGC
jgi:ATP-dependent Clp protease ATP-binding subunit ClpB